MRNLDVTEAGPGESEDDREARALLNKFLGAQALLSGMEPLVHASGVGSSSAALVSQVERQRIVGTTKVKTTSVTAIKRRAG